MKDNSIEKYEIRVDGRLYEYSHGTERMETITAILRERFGDDSVEVKKLRKNSNKYKWH